jgi:sugar phosphate isomerase/epimerase
VCSWSLQPRSARELAERVRAAGLDAVQLALDPIRDGAMPLAEVLDVFARERIAILSGMMAMAGEDYSTLHSIRRTGGVVPAATWAENVAAAASNARLAHALGIRLVTFHAGFVPHDASDPQRAVLLERLSVIARTFAAEGVEVALETGQETAETLAELLAQLEPLRVGVNFDPANIILYGMGDPLAALRRLAPHVRQVHIKDARAAVRPGEWGSEVPVGDGDVDWAAFFALLMEARIEADLVIEREASTTRVADVQMAVQAIRDLQDITRHDGAH